MTGKSAFPTLLLFRSQALRFIKLSGWISFAMGRIVFEMHVIFYASKFARVLLK
jgi:hypothetical protein